MIRKDKPAAGRNPKQPEIRAPRSPRTRVLAAFRALGHGVDPHTARDQMHAFYRSSGAEWTRGLS